MKKIIYFILLITLLLTGCGKKEQMVHYIPTVDPKTEDEDTITDSTDNVSTDEALDTSEETPTPKTIHVGQTTTMYVKLDKYGAYLNVRAEASTDSDIVGALVHTEKIEVIDITNGWASFAMDNEIRYVNADFLVDERPEYIAPPSPTPTPKSTPTPKNTPTPQDTPAHQDTPTPQDTPTSTPVEDEEPPEI